jgi:MFS family permease
VFVLLRRGFFTLGRVLASFAALVWSPSTLLFGSLPLALLGALAALLAPAAMMQQQGWWLLMGVTVLIGLGVSAGFANSLALLDSYSPCTGSITGLLGGVAGAGCMTIPLVVALLAKHTSLQYQGLMWVCLVSFGVQLACVPVVLLFGRRLKREEAAKVKDLDLQDDTGVV